MQWPWGRPERTWTVRSQLRTLVLFRIQAGADELESVPVTRVQKRVLHLLAQKLELGFADKSIHLRDAPPRQNEEAPSALTPWNTGSSSRSANLAREQVLKRFLSRGAGFVTGLRNKENAEICSVDLDMPGLRGKNLGAVAADQFVTSYFCSASQCLLRKLSQQQFRHMSYYEDASKVATHEVPGLWLIRECFNFSLCSGASVAQVWTRLGLYVFLLFLSSQGTASALRCGPCHGMCPYLAAATTESG